MLRRKGGVNNVQIQESRTFRNNEMRRFRGGGGTKKRNGCEEPMPGRISEGIWESLAKQGTVFIRDKHYVPRVAS